jgi:hypothetical protein
MISNSDKLYFLETITSVSLSKDGLNAAIWCPFCKHPNKNKLKMIIHIEKNFYHCWLCDKKGSNVSYLVSRISQSHAEKAATLFKSRKTNTDFLPSNALDLFGLSEEVEKQEENVEIPDGFDLLVNAYNSPDPDARDVFRYAIKRGADKNKFWFLRLGYSLSSDFRRYLILPSLDDKGQLNYYTARKIDVDTHDSFKYKNASIQKKNIVFNDINIDWSLPLTLVEGPLDLLKTNDNATCLLGSNLTEDMLLFKKIISNKTTINLSLDADAYHKALKIASLLDSYNIEVNILDTRGYEDVGDMSREQFLEVLSESKQYQTEDRLLSKIAML